MSVVRYGFLLLVLMFLGESIIAQVPSTDFVEVTISDDRPFVGEQITYTVRWYSTSDSEVADAADIIWPSFEGFGRITEDYFSTTDRRENTLYSVVVLEMTLLPLRAGQMQIEPFRLTVPPSPFQEEFIIESPSLDVNVRDLPADQPDTFINAIGQFSVEASIDKTQVTAQEQVIYTISVIGMGNLQQIAVPQLAFPEGWRVYETRPRYQELSAGLRSKQFMWQLERLQPGDFVINSAAITTFDPQQETYRTLMTSPFNINVTASNQAEINTSSIMMPEENTRSVPEWVTIGATHPIDVTRAPFFWLLWLVPVVIASALWSFRFFGKKQPKLSKSNLSDRMLQRHIATIDVEDSRIACEEMLRLLQASTLPLEQLPWVSIIKQLQEARFAPTDDIVAGHYKQQILKLLKR